MISHHHKCIFVHIPKTAGQSIETVFLNDVGLDWNTRDPLLLRANNNPKLGPPRLAHLKANEYFDYCYIPRDMFDSYFKFTFVRNPWDRAVSFYKYLGFKERMNFPRFIFKVLLSSKSEHQWFMVPQSHFIFDQNGKSLLDFVGRFESLRDDFKRICTSVNLKEVDLPHVNSSRRKTYAHMRIMKSILYRTVVYSRHNNAKSYRDYYDDAARDAVAQHYREDIEHFEYSF